MAAIVMATEALHYNPIDCDLIECFYMQLSRDETASNERLFAPIHIFVATESAPEAGSHLNV
ncbi:hypothetical protein OUZ56_000056 [Daphnia magna]|uniref:Uncharacterized protein n=1 Tax=Daphnia magna TaxID=35525 RepID=A0ABQ9ZZB2_9CRUS|nr:hypothetical protein OUZ56_000056 [Daphnia magna]